MIAEKKQPKLEPKKTEVPGPLLQELRRSESKKPPGKISLLSNLRLSEFKKQPPKEVVKTHKSLDPQKFIDKLPEGTSDEVKELLTQLINLTNKAAAKLGRDSDDLLAEILAKQAEEDALMQRVEDFVNPPEEPIKKPVKVII